LGVALFGDPTTVDLDHRVLIGIMFLAGVTGICSTIENLVIGTSILMVAASLACTAAGLLGYWAARRTKKPARLKVAGFLFFLALLIFSWITQAGTNGTIGYYFILLGSFAMVLFKGAGKLVSLLVTVATVMALLLLEHHFPTAMLLHASAWERFADVATALPLCLFMSATIIHMVHREYQREKAAKDEALRLMTNEKERVETAMQEKQRLLAVVSHDIANALTVLQGEISLTRFATGSDRPTHALDLDRMSYACTNIEEIIGSVRLMEALEQGRITYRAKAVDLAAVFEYAEVIFGKRLAERRMHLIFPQLTDEIRFVMAEPRILANQVFGNLLSNAIRFSYPDSTIAISVARQGNEATIGVADHGVGMPPDLLANLFDLDAHTTRAGTDGEPGTGFGLRTVKHFVELFGGQLQISSRAEALYPEDHGTTVTIRLPCGNS